MSMKKNKIYITTLFLIFNLTNADMMAKDLTEHKWKNRLILVIANDPSENQFNLQLEELKKHLPGLADRKVVVYKILPDKYQLENFKKDEWINSSDLYDDYKQSDSPFEVILIGLDGGVKLAKNRPVACEELFALIDSMPMRMRELKNRG